MQTRASANLCFRIVCMLLWLNARLKECKIFHQFFLLLIKRAIQNDVRENLDFVFPSHKDDISFLQSIILLQHRSFWVSRYWGMFFSFRNDFSVQRYTHFHKIKDLPQNSGPQQVTWSTFDTKGSRTQGATVQSVVTLATWRPGFLPAILKKKDEFIKFTCFFLHYTDFGCETNLV
jgi:hypothetical protein